MPDEHSLLSASGAEGWMTCHGKVVMEHGRGSSSEFADEGTAAHTLAQWVLDKRLSGLAPTARDFIGQQISVEREEGKARVFTVDATMAEHVDTYVDACMLACQGSRVLRYAEQRLYYATYLGVPRALAFGTGDFNAVLADAPALDWEDENGEVHHFPAGVEAQVHDLKYGMGVRVFAQNNSQLRLYGLGVLDLCDLLADVTRVRMVIQQPRLDHVSEEVISVEALLAWAAEPRAAAQVVLAVARAHADVRPELFNSWQDVPASLAKHLTPSDKACRFCDAKTVCPALWGKAAQFATGGARATMDDFAEVTVGTPTEVKAYGDNWLAEAADFLDLVDSLRKAVRAEIDNRVLSRGLTVPGFKIVQGAMGDRKWTDPAAAEKALLALGAADKAYSSKVISPTAAEKLLKKSSPQFAGLQHLITRAPGAPSVVRDVDPRPAFTGHQASADDFNDVTQAQPAPRHPFR